MEQKSQRRGLFNVTRGSKERRCDVIKCNATDRGPTPSTFKALPHPHFVPDSLGPFVQLL